MSGLVRMEEMFLWDKIKKEKTWCKSFIADKHVWCMNRSNNKKVFHPTPRHKCASCEHAGDSLVK